MNNTTDQSAVFVSGAVLLSPAAASLTAKALRVANESLLGLGGAGLTPAVLAVGQALERATRASVAHENTSHASGLENTAGELGSEADTLTATQAAAELGITASGVRDLARRGRVRATKHGSTWTFARHEVDAFRTHRRRGNEEDQ
ncbi:helix-turn-helix domain-containing protein [Rhodococcus sp. JS3073]|uniref:helix-turn-helix domain-containing protein n=1 Tax=Rhodococcus sp. JS3073 TaxID=3002901 RepID=UPI002285A1CD|nr:helix-turn-helix domain-containing protein [Rhodococcus sp. JS3073]WAM17511.1 helix-turn-helix domain-containing protein [Rhodococcus sp. JS3073]